MPPLTREKLEEIINSGDFNQLKGYYENDWFDCKREPYNLTTEKNKRELAKDVSAFANSDGGYILIGVKGENDPTHSGEQIKKISSFEANLIDIEQHRKIIESWVYPKLENVQLNWFPSNEDNKRGLVLIKIPPQNEVSKPFLIKNVLIENKATEIMFGLAQRRGDNSSPYELRDIHRLIQQGQNYEKNIKARFDAIERKLQEPTNRASFEDIKKKLEGRIETTLIRNNQKEKRNLVLAGCLEGDFRVRNFNSSNELKNLVQNYTKPLRDGGWKLIYTTDVMIDSLDSLELGFESNSLSLYGDGTAIYVREINMWLLYDNRSILIPISLVEIIYQFADFYKKFLSYVEGDIDNIIVKFSLNNLKTDEFETKLPFNLRLNDPYFSHLANENVIEHQIEIESDFEPKELAFRILKKIYEKFGFEKNPPFTKIENNKGVIDIEDLTKS